ncbi:hypothetical protein [Paraburkholderia azotifigens]|uniref:Uncharacterized protein n=1 Tax=Paraburkholderia azotifigens TaxID=2057004 RepID=A0ABU9R5U8_9BURK
MKSAFRIACAYAIELLLAYGSYFLVLYFLDRQKAEFLSGLALTFTIIACLISRPPAPHVLLRFVAKPWIGLVFLVNVVFGVLTAPTRDYASLVPGAALMLIMGSMGECFRRNRERNTSQKKDCYEKSNDESDQ